LGSRIGYSQNLGAREGGGHRAEMKGCRGRDGHQEEEGELMCDETLVVTELESSELKSWWQK